MGADRSLATVFPAAARGFGVAAGVAEPAAVIPAAARATAVIVAVIAAAATVAAIVVVATATAAAALVPAAAGGFGMAFGVTEPAALPAAAAGSALVEIHLTETFSGDIEGDSPVRALQVLRDDRSACLASLQRVSGKLHGRPGAFVLQGAATVEDGRIKATWFVVPGSETDALAGLRGEGGFEGELGKGSERTLDYWFE